MAFTFTEYKGNDLVQFESQTARDDGMVVVKPLGSFGKSKASALVSMIHNGLTADQAKQVFKALVQRSWWVNDVPAEELIEGATELVGTGDLLAEAAKAAEAA
jgi:hypothetical protein